jgi:hypothetical protein
MSPKGVKTALVVISILSGMIVALVTGILVRSGGGNLPSAILSGGGAFAATVALVLTIVKFLELLVRKLGVWQRAGVSPAPARQRVNLRHLLYKNSDKIAMV